jgi:hypothetical protein
MNETNERRKISRTKVGIGLGVAGVGLVIFLLGVNPGWFRMDRSPVFGFVQIAVFLAGLGLLCLGGFVVLNSLWNGVEKSILADIGFRLAATGYVICVASGLADILGLGNQPFPAIPYFGPWQAVGVTVGEVVIVLGFLFSIPYKKTNSPE